MRRIKLHRRASAYLRRMPETRRDQMIAALEEVASLADISTHPNIRQLRGRTNWFRLRVGVYRAIMQPQDEEKVPLLFVEYIGPRGDAY